PSTLRRRLLLQSPSIYLLLHLVCRALPRRSSGGLRRITDLEPSSPPPIYRKGICRSSAVSFPEGSTLFSTNKGAGNILAADLSTLFQRRTCRKKEILHHRTPPSSPIIQKLDPTAGTEEAQLGSGNELHRRRSRWPELILSTTQGGFR
ncbi:hypothetical protein PIB30_094597, partial [Stylosanthes scabra]|nr:hypothetical protein [Stylosanthes scabra]